MKTHQLQKIFKKSNQVHVNDSLKSLSFPRIWSIIMFMLIGGNLMGQGSEDFTNSALTNSYATGSFNGNNSITWSYIASRNEDIYAISGKGIMLRRVADNSKITSSSISNGIGSFTCNLKKAFTGAGNRQVELFINGVSKGSSIAWDNTTIQTFTVNNINISGSIIIEVRNITANQVVVDNITWTGYSASSAPLAPNISSITPTNQQLSVAFTAGGDGGSAITNYKYSTDGGTSFTLVSPAQTTSPIVITGLTNGTTYNVQIKAVNSVGDGTATASTQATPATIPSSPTITSITPGNQQLSVAFTAGATGGAAITNYKYSLDGGSSFTPVSPAATTSPITIISLTNGTQYDVQLKAVNAQGDGIATTSMQGTPSAAAVVPGSPTITSITPSNGQLSVAFTTGATGGSAITNYKYSTDGGSTFNALTPPSTTSPITITGLINGTTYNVQIKAVNDIGDGTATVSTAAAPGTIPSAPTITGITAGNELLSVSFTAGFTGGSAITNYKYSTNGGITFTAVSPTATTTPITITGLSNGTLYDVQLKAVNAFGDGIATASVSATPVTTSPGAPIIGSANAGNGQATVSFTAPVSNGGSTITSYTATSNPGNITGTLSQEVGGTIIVNGLTNGVVYTFTVTATNGVGTSVASAASNSITPLFQSAASDYFRSKTSGDWANAGTWESSVDGSTNWLTATLAPTFSANAITIANGHTITISTSVSIDQVTVQSGGILTLSAGGAPTIVNGAGDDIVIQNGGRINYQFAPTYTSSTIRINGGGILSMEVSGITGNGTGVNASSHIYDHAAILQWNLTTTNPSSSGVTYFPNVTTEIPIFRFASGTSSTWGASNPTIVNGKVEILNGIVITLGGTATKTFKYGLSGAGTLNQGTSGTIIFSGSTAEIGGTSKITLGTNGLTVSSNLSVTGTIDCGANIISGSGAFTLSSGATLKTSHASGLNGAIMVSGTKTFSSLANYEFNGATSGTFTTAPTANAMNNLTINRSAGVTLSQSFTTNGTLTLTSGTLDIGANTLTIGGPVSQTSGNIDADAGTVSFTNSTALSLPTSLFSGNIYNLSKESGAGAVTLNDNLTVTNELNSAASTGAFIIASSKELTISGTCKATINGTITNNGSFTLNSGATLLQGSSSSITNGTYNVKQTITGSGGATPNGRFWYLGSPLSNGSSTALLSSTGNQLWQWDETNVNYSTMSTGLSLSQGKSYVLRSGQTAETISFSGTGLTNGALNILNLSRTGTSAQMRGCHLVSNPYPSYLDWDLVGKTNVSTTMYVRTALGSNFNVLETYNSFDQIGTSLSGTPMTKDIAPMQGFWVKVTTDGQTGSLAMDNGMRSHQANGAGLRSSAQNFPAFLRMNVLDGENKDQVILFMSPDATSALDAHDSEKLPVTGFAQIYSIVDAKKLVINGMKNVKSKTSIPLTLDLPSSKSYTFQAEEFNIEDGLILLEDKQEGLIQDLTINPVYSFFGNAGTNNTRFVIHFQLAHAPILVGGPAELEILGNDELTTENIHIVSNNQGLIEVRLEEGFNPDGIINIFDASGRIVAHQSFNNQVELIELGEQNGIYFVEVSAGKVISKKKIVILH